MNLGTPEGCRAEADRLESRARVLSNMAEAARHEDRARERRLIAAKLEADEADPLPF